MTAACGCRRSRRDRDGRRLARLWLVLALAAALAGCEPGGDAAAPIYETAVVEERDIQVDVEAAGVVEPETTVEVKSKASGEILAVHAETGDVVDAGTLLVEIDERTARNQLAEAEAALVAARARLRIAETQNRRSERLLESGTLTQQEVEQTQLDLATAQAQVVSAEVAVENARIALDDTEVRAPIAGTIIVKEVEPGSVISSPTQGISDGTALMQMADLSTVQVRTLVDETDIGKIAPGMPAKVTVAAYPNQPFQGAVLKIEPQAVVEQNVTMFPVIIELDNPDGLLKPGMNADVEIGIASREGVPAVPTAALRADGDVAPTAAMLGLDLAAVEAAVLGGGAPRRFNRGRAPGFDGGPPPAFADWGGDGGGQRSSRGVTQYQFGGSYWVVALQGRRPVPRRVETGLTDLAFTEIRHGLELGDEVLLLPSSSLFEQQTRLQDFISRRFSGGTPFSQRGERRGPPFF